MILGSIVWDVDPILLRLGSIELRWYGLMWGLGFILAYEMGSRLFKKEGHPDDWADKLFVYCIVSAVVGARLGHCLFYEWDYYGSHPLEILKIWKGRIGKPRRCIRTNTCPDMVFQKGYTQKCVVAVRPSDTCSSSGLCMYSFRKSDELRNIRISYRPPMGI